MVIQTRLISSQYFFTRENVLFVRCRRDVPHSTPHRVYNFSCHMFISTSHCRAKRHNLDMGAARLRKYIRNANPSNISSLSLKSPPFSPDPCSLVSLFHLLSRHTRTAPRRPSLASHTPADSPEEGFLNKYSKVWKPWRAAQPWSWRGSWGSGRWEETGCSSGWQTRHRSATSGSESGIKCWMQFL